MSNPHTSMISLRTCVCMFACLHRPLTVHTFEMSAFKYFTKIYCEACEGRGGLLSEWSVGDPERRRLKLKHAWHWFVFLLTTAGHSQVAQIYCNMDSG